MFSDKFNEVMQYEGVVTIVTMGAQPTQVTNTWNSYLKIDPATNKIYIPAMGMHSIEDALKAENKLKLTMGTKEVTGTQGPGAGFHLSGKGFFHEDGPIFDEMKAKFPWLTRVLEVDVEKEEQKI